MDTISLSLDTEARAAFGRARDLDAAGETERARAARIRGCRLQGHADHYAARTRSSPAPVAPSVAMSLAA